MKGKHSFLPLFKNRNFLRSIKNFFLNPLSPHIENTMGNSESSRKKVQKGKSQSTPDFRYVNGRKYHNESNSPYILSSGLDEIDRQQLQHYCFKHIFKCNMSAPVEQMLIKGCKVLDVGCSAGIWLLELSTEYEKSEFFGVDMSAVFPSQIKPLNCNFIKANVLNGLPFPSDEFDYIHLSMMNGCFNDDQWKNIVIPELVRVLKPDGWLELYDVDVIQLNGGPLIIRLTNSAQAFLRSAGLNPHSPNLYKEWFLSYECLKDIREIIKYPFIGEWKGEITYEDIDDNIVEERDTRSENNLSIKEDNDVKVDIIKSKDDAELGKLIKEVLKMFYALDSDYMSKFMGVSKKEFLDILEDCYEREMTEYDTRMKFLRVFCRKEKEIL